jgi:hypothetical protein
MSMKRYYSVYKCELCGSKFTHREITFFRERKELIFNFTDCNLKQRIMHECNCAGHVAGVANFVGVSEGVI